MIDAVNVGMLVLGKNSFILADEENPLRMCKYCKKIYIAENENEWFCSNKCKTNFEQAENR